MTPVLDQFRAALARNDSGVRLLVPTITMARHIRNRIAREGFVLRPSLVQTLSRFIEPWAGLPQVSDAQFYLIVEAAARRVNRPEFARVAHMPGFCASLARTLEEFSSAGCDSRRLARHLPQTPLGDATLAVFAEVDRELERRCLALRAARLEHAAAQIREHGIEGVHTVWLEGFHALPDPELAVIDAIQLRAEVTVATPTRTEPPAVETVEAASIEREADEIARRILEEAAAGRPFREIGIVVRNADVYEPILRAAFERFGIPARFYMDAPLAEHGVTRFLAGSVDALAGGWDHQATMEVLRMHPSLGNSSAMDRLDFDVRRRLPRSGLGLLKELAEDPGILALIGQLEALEAWKRAALQPGEWVERFRALTAIYRPPRPSDAATHQLALDWRAQAAALSAFGVAVGEAAAWFGAGRAVALAEFWRAVKAILRLSPLRLEDGRRNVVHVLSAYEARQWELPVVFVCGLVEGQFPRYAPQNPFFPDAARRQLQGAGIRVRTTADAEAEEQALFDSAVTRASDRLVLSYAKFDERGEQNLPSLFLDRFPPATPVARAVLPRLEPCAAAAIPPGAVAAADLREAIALRHGVMRVTAVESYAQCPFQFFARYTLKLEEAPARPEDRLDYLLQGNIVHSVLAEWVRAPQPIEALFERIFGEICRKELIPGGYRTELLRTRMRDDLVRFARDSSRPVRPDTRVEEKFEFALADGIILRGRIDRLDRTADSRWDVTDYKYSKQASETARNDSKLQGPLYLLAVEKALQLDPGAMKYCGLRGAVQWFDSPVTPERMRGAIDTTLRAAREIREGNATPHPAELDKCRWCECKDVCRYRAAGATAVSEGA